jgi:hypothetical protein
MRWWRFFLRCCIGLCLARLGKTVDTLLGQWTERPKYALQKAKRLHLPNITHLIRAYTAHLKYFSVWLIFLIYLNLFNNVSSAEWDCIPTTEIITIHRGAEKSSRDAQWTLPATRPTIKLETFIIQTMSVNHAAWNFRIWSNKIWFPVADKFKQKVWYFDIICYHILSELNSLFMTSTNASLIYTNTILFRHASLRQIYTKTKILLTYTWSQK